MPTPHRILRAQAQARDPKPLHFSIRDLERHDRILTVGRALLAENGRHNVTFAGLAVALSIGTAALRRHFADIDALLGEILRHHLQAIATALGAIPHTDPDRDARRRAAYIAFTRTALGGFTEAHLLLLRDRNLLPDDEHEPIERTRTELARILGGHLADEVLNFLDLPNLDAGDAEYFFGKLVARRAAQAAQAAAPAPARAEPLQPPAAKPPAPARRLVSLIPPDPNDPEDGKIPGDWIFDANLPGVAPRPGGPVSQNQQICRAVGVALGDTVSHAVPRLGMLSPIPGGAAPRRIRQKSSASPQ